MKIFFIKYGLVFKWDASQATLVTNNLTFMFLDNKRFVSVTNSFPSNAPQKTMGRLSSNAYTLKPH